MLLHRESWYSPAPSTVRGNATFIDHGWGVYSAYYHQKEINVGVGQQVQAGQLIGQIGATGRVTGPHLHWEIWVNGIQVNPLDWLRPSIIPEDHSAGFSG